MVARRQANPLRRHALDRTPETLASEVIELVKGRLAVTDLGIGNCPTFHRTATASRSSRFNPGGAEPGVWLMEADGWTRALGELWKAQMVTR